MGGGGGARWGRAATELVFQYFILCIRSFFLLLPLTVFVHEVDWLVYKTVVSLSRVFHIYVCTNVLSCKYISVYNYTKHLNSINISKRQ